MDLVSLFPIICVFSDTVMAIFIAKHYIETRFRPSFLLFLQSIVFIVVHAAWIPITLLGQENYALARNFMFLAIFSTLAIPTFTIAFFESTRNKPLNILLVVNILYYAFLVGYAFSIDWIFEYERIWRYQIHGIVLFLFASPFMGIVIYIFYRLFKIFFPNVRKTKAEGEYEQYDRKTKMTIFVWTVALLFRYLSMLLLATGGVDLSTVIIRISSVVVLTVVFLYDPNAFFLSTAQIKSLTFFDAQSGITLFSQGIENDDCLLASGLQGSSILQKEIAGASSFPNTLRFVDRIILIDYQKVRKTIIAAALIVDKFNPIFMNSLKFTLQIFVKMFSKNLDDWNGNLNQFENFGSITKKFLGYAFPAQILTSGERGCD